MELVINMDSSTQESRTEGMSLASQVTVAEGLGCTLGVTLPSGLEYGQQD